jgi:hypothetical protein
MHFQGRFRGKPDINRLTKPAGSVDNEPEQTSPPRLCRLAGEEPMLVRAERASPAGQANRRSSLSLSRFVFELIDK